MQVEFHWFEVQLLIYEFFKILAVHDLQFQHEERTYI